MYKNQSIDEFLVARHNYFVIDVRSPLEFQQGHIPNAHSIPLFSDALRARIGTLYKQQGRKAALEEGLKQIDLYSYSQKLCEANPSLPLLVYCARGGMRSASLAWLWDLLGYSVCVLEGGYKAFRAALHKEWDRERNLKVLGGKTGVGKTFLLQLLKGFGEAVIPLEELAQHKGSVFGGMEGEQPTQEAFENNLSLCLYEAKDASHLWIEDESRFIGKNRIPDLLFQQMRQAPVVLIERPLEERMTAIIKEYAIYPHEEMKKAIQRLHKRLGELATKQALLFFEENKLEECSKILLHYYDKSYSFDLSKRDPSTIFRLPMETKDNATLAKQLLVLTKQKPVKSDALHASKI